MDVVQKEPEESTAPMGVRAVVDTAVRLSATLLTTLVHLVKRSMVAGAEPRDVARDEWDHLLALMVEQQKSIEKAWSGIQVPGPPEEQPLPPERRAVLIYPLTRSPVSAAAAGPDILSDLRTHLDVRAHAIRVVYTRSIRDGGLVVQLHSKRDVENFVRVFRAHPVVAQRYEVKIPLKVDPRVIVFEVDVDADTLLKAIADLADGSGAAPRVHIVKRRGVTARGRTHYVISLDGDTFRRVMAEGRLSIDWATYAVAEYDTVHQCFRCGRFGHSGPWCRREKRCRQCGYPVDMHDHDAHACDWPPRCINCYEKNGRDGGHRPTQHAVRDRTCPVWRAEVHKYRQRHIDYGNTERGGSAAEET